MAEWFSDQWFSVFRPFFFILKSMGGGQRNFSVNPNDYKILEEVGYGASATVHRAIYLPSNEVVAVKCLDLDRCNSNLVCLFLNFFTLFVCLILFSSGFCVFWRPV